MKDKKKTREFWAIAVGPSEHRRAKIMAAQKTTTLADFVGSLINNAWQEYGAKQNNSTMEKNENVETRKAQ